jgi:hypothetical protein
MNVCDFFFNSVNLNPSIEFSIKKLSIYDTSDKKVGLKGYFLSEERTDN